MQRRRQNDRELPRVQSAPARSDDTPKQRLREAYLSKQCIDNAKASLTRNQSFQVSISKAEILRGRTDTLLAREEHKMQQARRNHKCQGRALVVQVDRRLYEGQYLEAVHLLSRAKLEFKKAKDMERMKEVKARIKQIEGDYLLKKISRAREARDYQSCFALVRQIFWKYKKLSMYTDFRKDDTDQENERRALNRILYQKYDNPRTCVISFAEEDGEESWKRGIAHMKHKEYERAMEAVLDAQGCFQFCKDAVPASKLLGLEQLRRDIVLSQEKDSAMEEMEEIVKGLTFGSKKDFDMIRHRLEKVQSVLRRVEADSKDSQRFSLFLSYIDLVQKSESAWFDMCKHIRLFEFEQAIRCLKESRSTVVEACKHTVLFDNSLHRIRTTISPVDRSPQEMVSLVVGGNGITYVQKSREALRGKSLDEAATYLSRAKICFLFVLNDKLSLQQSAVEEGREEMWQVANVKRIAEEYKDDSDEGEVMLERFRVLNREIVLKYKTSRPTVMRPLSAREADDKRTSNSIESLLDQWSRSMEDESRKSNFVADFFDVEHRMEEIGGMECEVSQSRAFEEARRIDNEWQYLLEDNQIERAVAMMKDSETLYRSNGFMNQAENLYLHRQKLEGDVILDRSKSLVQSGDYCDAIRNIILAEKSYAAANDRAAFVGAKRYHDEIEAEWKYLKVLEFLEQQDYDEAYALCLEIRSLLPANQSFVHIEMVPRKVLDLITREPQLFLREEALKAARSYKKSIVTLLVKRDEEGALSVIRKASVAFEWALRDRKRFPLGWEQEQQKSLEDEESHGGDRDDFDEFIVTSPQHINDHDEENVDGVWSRNENLDLLVVYGVKDLELLLSLAKCYWRSSLLQLDISIPRPQREDAMRDLQELRELYQEADNFHENLNEIITQLFSRRHLVHFALDLQSSLNVLVGSGQGMHSATDIDSLILSLEADMSLDRIEGLIACQYIREAENIIQEAIDIARRNPVPNASARLRKMEQLVAYIGLFSRLHGIFDRADFDASLTLARDIKRMCEELQAMEPWSIHIPRSFIDASTFANWTVQPSSSHLTTHEEIYFLRYVLEQRLSSFIHGTLQSKDRRSTDFSLVQTQAGVFHKAIPWLEKYFPGVSQDWKDQFGLENVSSGLFR